MYEKICIYVQVMGKKIFAEIINFPIYLRHIIMKSGLWQRKVTQT